MFITALVIFVAVELPLTAWAVMRLIRAGASHRVTKGPFRTATPVVPEAAPRADEISAEELVPVLSPDLITGPRVGGCLNGLRVRLFCTFAGELFFVPLEFNDTPTGVEFGGGFVASVLNVEGGEDMILASIVAQGRVHSNLWPVLVPPKAFADRKTVLLGAVAHVRPSLSEPIPVPRVLGRVWLSTEGKMMFAVWEGLDNMGVLIRHAATGRTGVLRPNSAPITIPSGGLTVSPIRGFSKGTLKPIPSKFVWELAPRYSRTWRPDRRGAS